MKSLEPETPGPVFGQRDPDARGYFGEFGGRFVPETLVAPVEELTAAYFAARTDEAFRTELRGLLSTYVGRPTPLYEARRAIGTTGVRLFLKREDLAHTGAHKINNALGQALLAKRMGKRRIVAETGAGQHGVASATACALLGLECVVYMGAEDMARQALNVFRMRVLGASVERVDAGSRTLKDAINEAMRDWVSNVETTYYLLGSVLGPHPYPLMVREFQSVIGQEARAQILRAAGRLPDVVVACVGGGSNSMGVFDAFVDDTNVRLVGVEAGGRGIRPGDHAARFAGGRPGVLHGTYSQLLQDDHGNILLTHSVSAGLDYASIGPEHAWLASRGRSEYDWIDDTAALEGFEWLARAEGILPALESSHAVAWVKRELPGMKPGTVVLLNLSGRGDKDVETVRQLTSARRESEQANAGEDRVSRIETAFGSLRASRRPGLVTYVTAGDPDLARSREVILALARAGADVIEVGVPFSDPIADGPAIQRASERALAAGSHLGASLDLVASVRREIETPIVLFSYVNPVLQMGVGTFASRATAAGVDGVLLLDLPIEEAESTRKDLGALDLIFLVSPTTTERRLREAGRIGRGFLYAISRLGVTGTRDAVASSAKPLVDRIRAVTSLPIALGFGVSRPEHVAEVNAYADAAVVGSAIVQTIQKAAENGGDVAGEVEQFVTWLKNGTTADLKVRPTA